MIDFEELEKGMTLIDRIDNSTLSGGHTIYLYFIKGKDERVDFEMYAINNSHGQGELGRIKFYLRQSVSKLDWDVSHGSARRILDRDLPLVIAAIFDKGA
jgi:hypothetical protein